MDFGLGRYLEMFEERFGHRATTGLVLFITAGLVAVISPLIWRNLWEPIYGAATSFAHGRVPAFLASLTWGDFVAFLTTGMVLFGGIVILASGIWVQFDTKYLIEMRRMNRLRRVAMTGPEKTEVRIAKRRLRTFLIVLPIVACGVAFVYFSIVATGAKIQLNTLEPQLNADIAKKDKLLKLADRLDAKTDATSRNIDKLKISLDGLEKQNGQLRDALSQICRKSPTVAATCKAALAATIQDDIKGPPASHPGPPERPASPAGTPR